MKKIFLTTIMLLATTTAQAVMPIASFNEPCMWPWTRPDITVNSKWKAVKCTGGKDPYMKSCQTDTYHILSIKDGYAQYYLTYTNRAGNQITVKDSGSIKFISCSYNSFKEINN